MPTGIDWILDYLKKKADWTSLGQIVKDAVQSLGVNDAQVIKWLGTLESEGIIEVAYKFGEKYYRAVELNGGGEGEELQQELDRMEKEVETKKEQLSAGVSESKKRLEQIQQELEALKKELPTEETINKAYQKLQQRLKKLEAAIEAMEQKVSEVGKIKELPSEEELKSLVNRIDVLSDRAYLVWTFLTEAKKLLEAGEVDAVKDLMEHPEILKKLSSLKGISVGQIDRLKKKLEEVQMVSSDLEIKLSGIRDEIEELNRRLKEMESVDTKKIRKAAEVLKKIDLSKIKDIQAMRDEMQSIEEEYNQWKKDVDQRVSVLLEAISQNADALKTYKALEKIGPTFLDNIKKGIEALRHEISAVREQIDSIETSAQEKRQKIEELTQALHEVESLLDEAEGRVKKTEEKVQKLEDVAEKVSTLKKKVALAEKVSPDRKDFLVINVPPNEISNIRKKVDELKGIISSLWSSQAGGMA